MGEKYLYVGQFYFLPLVGQFGEDGGGERFAVFYLKKRAVAGRFQHLENDLLHGAAAHFLQTEAVLEDAGAERLELRQVTDELLPHDEQHPARHFVADEAVEVGEEVPFFFLPPGNEQFLELIEEQIDGLVPLGEQGIDGLPEIRFRVGGQACFGVQIQLAPDGP